MKAVTLLGILALALAIFIPSAKAEPAAFALADAFADADPDAFANAFAEGAADALAEAAAEPGKLKVCRDIFFIFWIDGFQVENASGKVYNET